MDDYHSEEGTSGDPCFYYPIPGGLLDKDVIEITGYFYGEKIVIEILAESYVQNGANTALPLQFTLTNAGKWTTTTFSKPVNRQTQSGSAGTTENFQIRIVSFENVFEIYLDGSKLCSQKHLIPLPQVTHLSIDGEAEFTGVEFKDLCSENEASSHSSSSSSSSSSSASHKGQEVVPGFTRLSENRRSSNRKPKPPVLVQTHGSFRAKQALEPTREEHSSRSSSSSSSSSSTAQGSKKETVEVTPAGDSVEAGLGAFVAAPVAAAVVNSKPRSRSPSPKRVSSSRTGHRDSKRKGLRDKLHLKRGSKSSSAKPPAVVHEENQYANPGTMGDVWVNEGGREVSVDGSGLVIGAAISAPNLHSQPPQKKKEKKRLFGKGDKKHKERSASSPPTEGSSKEKKRHLGLHLKKKDEKAPKEPKAKKFGGFRGKDKSGAKIGVAGGAAAAAAVVPVTVEGEYENPDNILPPVAAKPRSTSSSSSSSSSSRSGSRDLHVGVVKGEYDVAMAEKEFDTQHGTYLRTGSHEKHGSRSSSSSSSKSSVSDQVKQRRGSHSSASTNSSLRAKRAAGLEGSYKTGDLDVAVPVACARSKSSSSNSSSSSSRSGSRQNKAQSRSRSSSSASSHSHTATGGVSVGSKRHKKSKSKSKSHGKIKGDSPEIAAHLRTGTARDSSYGSYTYTDPSLDIPLALSGAGIAAGGVAGGTAVAMGRHPSKDKHKKKEGKFKGDSPEIAVQMMDSKRGMSNGYNQYTEAQSTYPLKLSGDDLLSSGSKGLTPIVGAKGSYDLHASPDFETGKIEMKGDADWEDGIISHTSASNVQHSMPPTAGIAVASPDMHASGKHKGKLLKGDAAEIASNLVDVESDRASRNSSSGGYPYCGEHGVGVPLKIDALNKNAQPIPYGSRVKSSRSHSVSSASSHSRSHSLDGVGGIAIAAQHEASVHAAPPLVSLEQGSLDRTSDSGPSLNAKSATMPASGTSGTSGTGTSGTLPGAVGGVAMRKGKKGSSKRDSKRRSRHHSTDGEDKVRKRDRMSAFFRRIFKKKKKGSTDLTSDDDLDTSGDNLHGEGPEMIEHRDSSHSDSESDSASDFAVTAKPSETCRYAAQLRGDRTALEGNFPITSLCGDSHAITFPLKLTAADIPSGYGVRGMIMDGSGKAGLDFAAPPLRSSSRSFSISPGGTRRARVRSGSLSSRSSVSPGGTHRRHHRRHRSKDSLSSWSSVSPGGTRTRHRRSRVHRPGSVSSGTSRTSVSPGGTRRRVHMRRHRSADSITSWSSVSAGGTKRHKRGRRRRDGSRGSVSSWSSVSVGGTRRKHTRGRKGRSGSRDSLSSYSSVSIGGTHRRRHRRKPHRKGSKDSLSSWSSVSAGGTRRHRRGRKHRAGSKDSLSSWSSVSAGGTRKRRHGKKHHRKGSRDSLSSWSSISAGGTHRRRHREADLIQLGNTDMSYSMPPNGGFNIQRQDYAMVHASRPRSTSTSSTSSISSVYGRVIIVGQSSDFHRRMQSYRRRTESPQRSKKEKKAKGAKRENGYGSDSSSSTSSISSMDSDLLPPSIVKVKGGKIAVNQNASGIIFDDHPRNPRESHAYGHRF